MGFLVRFGRGLFVSLVFCQRTLLEFAKGQPELRSRAFYQSRLVFHSIFVLMAGVSQLLLGIYLLMQYGSGPMPYGAVRVAMYVIHFPEIAIAVGGFQTLTALLGFHRAAGKFSHPDNHILQTAMGLSWDGTMDGTNLIQIYFSEPTMADSALAPTMVALTLGIHISPSLLDIKMRNLPYSFPQDFYDPPMRDNDEDKTDENTKDCGHGGDDTDLSERLGDACPDEIEYCRDDGEDNVEVMDVVPIPPPASAV